MVAFGIEQVRGRIHAVGQGLEVEKKRKIRSLGTFVFDQLERRGVISWFGKQVEERFHKLGSARWSTPEAASKFLKLTAEGYVPLMYAGHFVHIDADFMADGFSKLHQTATQHGLRENLVRGVVTVAKTVGNGVQDKFMEDMYPSLKAYAASRGVQFIEVTRPKDQEKYNAEKKMVTEDKPFVQAIRDKGTAVMVFPYGSIQAGRHPKGSRRGEIYGLPELYEPDGTPKIDLLKMYQAMESVGRRTHQKPYYQPVGISNSYRAQSPDTYRPTPEAFISLYDGLSRLLGFFGFRRLVVPIVLGEPITEEDIEKRLGSSWKENVDGLNRLLMEEEAKLLQPSERGEYSYVVAS